MKYALVGGQKSTPQPKLRGRCIHCGEDMIPKCGKVKLWHWAHKTTDMCDPWWENESLWHRAWKEHFPRDWQEVSHVNPVTGEKHIADVKNEFGLVIEFQRSTLSEIERVSREVFFQDMIWIVDGSRGSHDSAYFSMGVSGPVQKNPLLYGLEWWGQSRLLHFWSVSSKQVYLDFGHDVLWRLVSFNAETRQGLVGLIPKSDFIEDCLSLKSMRVTFIDDGHDIEQFRMPRPLVELKLSSNLS
ncbi:MAG: competence protein CoiA [Cyanobacteriota bacterium]